MRPRTAADDILDGLVHNAHRIEMRGDSMRANRGKPNARLWRWARLRIVDGWRVIQAQAPLGQLPGTGLARDGNQDNFRVAGYTSPYLLTAPFHPTGRLIQIH